MSAQLVCPQGHATMSSNSPTPLTALSPLDGRYASKVAVLRPLLSEFGLMHRRVQVEVEWFIALSDAGLPEFAPLSESARGLLRGLVLRFSQEDAQAIKDIERTTNHDVKAVEYWLKQRDRRIEGGQRIRPLCLHQRRYQQHQPRLDAQSRTQRSDVAHGGPPHCQAANHGA
jgi:hypothetical protein